LEDGGIVSKFDWSLFSTDPESYLDEIEIEWYEDPCNEIESHGTILIISKVKVDWNDDTRIAALKTILGRMVNPFEEIKDFSIRLVVNDQEILIEPSKVLEHPHYTVE
jgi:hypothetical protein